MEKCKGVILKRVHPRALAAYVGKSTSGISGSSLAVLLLFYTGVGASVVVLFVMCVRGRTSNPRALAAYVAACLLNRNVSRGVS